MEQIGPGAWMKGPDHESQDSLGKGPEGFCNAPGLAADCEAINLCDTSIPTSYTVTTVRTDLSQFFRGGGLPTF